MYRLYFASYTIGFSHSVLEDLFQLNWNEALFTTATTTFDLKVRASTRKQTETETVREREKKSGKMRKIPSKHIPTTGTTMDLHNSKTRTKANIWRKENNNDKESLSLCVCACVYEWERVNGAKNKENNNGI